jgi:VanZ family protein
MGLIFWSSATPDLKSVPLFQRFHLLPAVLGPVVAHALELIIRKGAHTLAYAVLAVLARWSLGGSFPGASPRRLTGFALGLAVLYACTDEWHQTFVPGREGRLTDVLIDTVGAVAGLSLWFLIRGRSNRGKGDLHRGRVGRG